MPGSEDGRARPRTAWAWSVCRGPQHRGWKPVRWEDPKLIVEEEGDRMLCEPWSWSAQGTRAYDHCPSHPVRESTEEGADTRSEPKH